MTRTILTLYLTLLFLFTAYTERGLTSTPVPVVVQSPVTVTATPDTPPTATPTPNLTPTPAKVGILTLTTEPVGATLETDSPLLVGTAAGKELDYTVILKNNSSVTDTYTVSLVGGRENYTLSGPDQRASYQAYINRDFPSFDAPYIEYADVGPQEQIPLQISRRLPDRIAGGKRVETVTVDAVGKNSKTNLQLTTVISIPTTIELINRVGLKPKYFCAGGLCLWSGSVNSPYY